MQNSPLLATMLQRFLVELPMMSAVVMLREAGEEATSSVEVCRERSILSALTCSSLPSSIHNKDKGSFWREGDGRRGRGREEKWGRERGKRGSRREKGGERE